MQSACRKRSSHILEYHPISAFLYLKDSIRGLSSLPIPAHPSNLSHNEDCEGPMVTGSCLFVGFPYRSTFGTSLPGETLKSVNLRLLQTTDPKERHKNARDVLGVLGVRPQLFTLKPMITPDCKEFVGTR